MVSGLGVEQLEAVDLVETFRVGPQQRDVARLGRHEQLVGVRQKEELAVAVAASEWAIRSKPQPLGRGSCS